MASVVMTNGSSLDGNVSSDNNDFAENETANIIQDIIIPSLCALALPGNLLVVAVYAGNMKSSARVYMFALAVADSVVCVCAIILTRQVVPAVLTVITMYVIDAAVSLSAFLLVFVSIERLLAVLRPYSFNMKPQRAKNAIGFLIVLAFGQATSEIVLMFNGYIRVGRIVGASLLGACMLTMTVCYATLAILLLLKRRRLSKYRRNAPSDARIATISSNVTQTSSSSVDSTEMATISSDENTRVSTTVSIGMDNIIREQPNAVVSMSATSGAGENVARDKSAQGKRKLVTSHVKSGAYKNVVLLFTITVVFIACWLPKWVNSIGVPVPPDVTHVFVFNSVVNPFIYGVASAMFRDDVRQFCRQTRAKLSRC